MTMPWTDAADFGFNEGTLAAWQLACRRFKVVEAVRYLARRPKCSTYLFSSPKRLSDVLIPVRCDPFGDFSPCFFSPENAASGLFLRRIKASRDLWSDIQRLLKLRRDCSNLTPVIPFAT